MGACRQFLNRPRVLISQLHRPVLADKPAAASAARWHGSDHTNLQGRCAKVQPSPETMKKKKHLYLVLDDTNNGISIHKLDLEKQLNDGGAPSGGDVLGRLPNPPVMRMESPSLGDHPTAAIVGSSIVGFGSGSPDLKIFDLRGGATVAFDTKTAALISLRDLPRELCDAGCIHLAVAVGKKLYVIENECSGLEYCDDVRPEKVLEGRFALPEARRRRCRPRDMVLVQALFRVSVKVSLVPRPSVASILPGGNHGSRGSPRWPRILHLSPLLLLQGRRPPIQGHLLLPHPDRPLDTTR
ncbi:hypothetical protein EJB05_25683, partial [Eragrostis curvula]